MQSTFEEIEKDIHDCGSDAPGKHGGLNLGPEDSMYIQQHAKEFATTLEFFIENYPSFSYALDIGLAAGGSARMFRKYIKCENSLFIDDGQHDRYAHWPRIKKLTELDTNILLDYYGNSHQPPAREALAPFKGKIDFAFIDGDHSFVGMLQDFQMVSEITTPDALVMFHDTIAVSGVKQAYNYLKEKKKIDEIFHTDLRYGIGVAKICL